MKTIILIFTVLTLSFNSTAQIAETITQKEMRHPKKDEKPYNKRIQITIKVNGYTIHIGGDFSYKFNKGVAKINGFISVNGNGVTGNNLVINYEGALKRGPYVYNADYSQVDIQDLELAEMILSHLNLKESRHIYFITE